MVIPVDLLRACGPSFLKSNIFVPVSHRVKIVVAMENPDYLRPGCHPKADSWEGIRVLSA
jgi:hypothetical protein